MNITATPQFHAPRSLPKLPAPAPNPAPSSLPGDQVHISSNNQPPEPPTHPESSFGRRVVGGITGALVGILAGHAGPGGVALAAGLGGAAVTVATAGPVLKEGLEQSLNGDLLNDLAMTCGTIAAGSMLPATTAGAEGGLGFALAYALPAASPVLGGLIGASVGAYFGMRN